MAGVELARVAEVIAGAGGTGRRGSGYEVTAGIVLTAAHVVAEASRVRVRFNADRSDERVVSATVSLADPAGDVAVLAFSPHGCDEGLSSVSYGRLGARAAVVTCMAVGFPRFKLRDDPRPGVGTGPPARYRDSHQANGQISSLSSLREGSLEVLVAAPERDPDPQHSPWEGMSGAALWSGGRIVGLVSKHHRSEGLNRLAATRVDRWYQVLSAQHLDRVCELTGLPRHAGQLPDVITADPLDAESQHGGQDPGSRGPTILTGDGNVLYENVSIITRNFAGRDNRGSGGRA